MYPRLKRTIHVCTFMLTSFIKSKSSFKDQYRCPSRSFSTISTSQNLEAALVGKMALSVTKLRREYEIRLWRKIIDENPYVAVVQVTGGRSWGGRNLKARILDKYLSNGEVGTRYAVPRSAREGALRSRFGHLANLFRSCGSAVVYGHHADSVIETVKRAQKIIDGGLLVGGRFGEQVVTAPIWERALQSEGEVAEWTQLVTVLSQPPPLLDVIDRSSKGLVQVLQQGGRANQLTNILQRMGEPDVER